MGKSKDLATRVGIDDNADATAITIDSSERVGIGTTTPDYLLTLAGTSHPRVRINSTDNSASGIFMHVSNGGSQTGSSTVRVDNSGNYSVYNGTSSEALNMNIDGSGRVTMPNQPSMSGRAIRPVNTASYANLNVNLYVADLTHNIGNAWNNSTGVWTCPVAGRYWVFASFLIDDNMTNGAVARYEFRKNGTEFFRGYDQSYNSGSTYGGMVTSGGIFNCSANDTITIVGTHGTLHTGSESTFTICLLG